MANKNKWIKINVEKWLLNLAELPPLEGNIYMRLRLKMLHTGKPLTNNLRTLAALACCSVNELADALDILEETGHISLLDNRYVWSSAVEEELNSIEEDLDCFNEDLDNLTLHENMGGVNMSTKSDKLPWIKFYLYDWLHGTSGMTFEQKAIYLTLILYMYDKKAPLKDDFGTLSRVCNCSQKKFATVVEYLIKRGKLIQTDSGHLWNCRVEAELNSIEEDLDCFDEDLDNLTLHENMGGKDYVK
ncbi:DUF1376 domain-containing protein [Bartonella rattaustraliani]|uniref:DUF1376 domain-containing protein n=1 Tax=Bartonella rattaustraliani TaxID=481139 RepID=UPI00031434C0|nr:DUF1376 domain-containing protein [Bartonella rattaustraliani]